MALGGWFAVGVEVELVDSVGLAASTGTSRWHGCRSLSPVTNGKA